MARLWARTTTYDSANVGDELPILVKWETADTIQRFRSLVGAGRETGPAPGQDEPVGTAAASQAMVAYVVELLEKGFPVTAIMAQGSSLTLNALAPVKAEDTISLSGVVTGKGNEGETNSVECVVTIENQDNVAVAEATATIVL